METSDKQVIYFSILIIVGISFAGASYQSASIPIESSLSYLNEIRHSSNPELIENRLLNLKTNLDFVMNRLPETTNPNGIVISKNPVWIFPSESTNFLRIQNDVDSMLKSTDKISILSEDSSAYHAGLMDIHNRANMIKTNLHDAIPFMYNTPENIVSNSVWLVGIMGLTEILLRRSNPNNI